MVPGRIRPRRLLSGLLGASIVLGLAVAALTSPRLHHPTRRRIVARASRSSRPAVAPASSARLDEAAEAFVARVQTSLTHNATASDFLSLTLVGRSKRDVKAYLAREEPPPVDAAAAAAAGPSPSSLRGTLRLAEARLVRLAAADGAASMAAPLPQLQVTFRYHLATDVVKNWPLDTVRARLRALLRAEDNPMDPELRPHVPITSGEWNLDDAASSSAPAPPLGSLWGIQYAVLETKRSTLRQEFTKSLRCSETKAPTNGNAERQLPSLSHDRVRQGPLAESIAPSTSAALAADSSRNQTFWQALGLVTVDHQLKPGKASKFRQCVKFVEIVHHLIQQQLTQPPSRTRRGASASDLSVTTTQLNILDMGCGRGYLTFALHEHLTRQGAGREGSAAPPTEAAAATADHRLIVRTKGIDIRPKLVHECNQIARSLGAAFDGLRFETGSIRDVVLKGDTNKQSRGSLFDWSEALMPQKVSDRQDKDLNILIALHACDTATDDALWAGISNGADIILVAPCCHKQVRPQIDRLARNVRNLDHHPLMDIVRFPIYRERLAETATDALRALLLELAGYSTVQVFEFIDGEHTAKNSMITAVRQGRGSPNTDLIKERIHRLASFHGIQQHKLAELMGESLPIETVNGVGDYDKEIKHPPNRGMPPL